jgi:PEP-CTERM motif
VRRGFQKNLRSNVEEILKKLLLLSGIAGLMVTTALANVNYNTTGSTLSCNGVAGCTQINTTSIADGGLTLTYNAGSGANQAEPTIINYGNIDTTGTGTNVNLSGLLLTININSTPPGGSGTLPNGAISGTLSTSSSTSEILFSPNNTTSIFGTLPGVQIGNELYQVLNPSLGLVPPTDGNPIGQTTIQGDVTNTAVPEPTTFLLMGAGLALAGIVRFRSSR